ncbi:hypothetical protein VSS74_25750 [Conexibacter stalactiti]|uniref:Uncharacterized protein n=1 Tax=Conexibacter stalactiti TaxID=1940611 RepID=A0ABU4HWT0_9ACTN|nr:hypothetical protein [Conexibacter stalactiti]MDW5597783.1 hypothetical protein [Conexibacter stalactiti]MEC5038425.1 hypothetical protein [Conexibacter stalactiti]
MRSLTLLPAAALCAALALPAAAAASSKRYSLEGTLTQTNLIVTRCPGLGGQGWRTETVTWETEHTIAGQGLVPTGGGQIQIKSRRRNRTVVTIEDNDAMKPATYESPWSRDGDKQVPFGTVVERKRNHLVFDGNVIVTGAGRRSEWPASRKGRSVTPDFTVAPQVRRGRRGTCEKTDSVELRGSLKATRLN